MILTYCRYEGLGKTTFLLDLLVVEAGVEVVVADGVVAIAPLPHKVLIFTPCMQHYFCTGGIYYALYMAMLIS